MRNIYRVWIGLKQGDLAQRRAAYLMVQSLLGALLVALCLLGVNDAAGWRLWWDIALPAVEAALFAWQYRQITRAVERRQLFDALQMRPRRP